MLRMRSGVHLSSRFAAVYRFGAAVGVAAMVVTPACGRTLGVGDMDASAASDEAVLVEGPSSPPLPFIEGDRIVGLPGGREVALDADPSGGLMGWLSPVAVPSPDGRSIAYNAWEWLVPVDPAKSWSQQGISPGDPVGVPSIRVVDLATGSERVLADGAFSLAWRDDGALAFFQGTSRTYRADEPFTGDILFRSSPEAVEETWTTVPDRYVVIAWARGRLLAYRMLEGERLDLLVFDGPGRSRLIAEGGELVAISPDGTRALVSSELAARVVDIASGEATARLDLARTEVSGEPLAYLAYGGSWVGDRVVAESGAGTVTLGVADGRIAVLGVIRLPATEFAVPPHEPRLSADGSRVVAWVPVLGAGEERMYTYLDCAVDGSVCARGPLLGVDRYYAVHNPSRPAA